MAAFKDYSYIMVSVEQELKLVQLESDFYRACNAVKAQGIELRELKTSFLEELLEIEQNKVIRLNQEIERLQVRDSVSVLWWVLFRIFFHSSLPDF